MLPSQCISASELTSNAILAWQQEHAIEWHYIAPGSRMLRSGSNCETACPPP
jgi:hypothetical protein